MPQRRGLVDGLRYAASNPDKARRYLSRLRRDVALRVRYRGDHIGYYREVMRSTVARGEEIAVGNSDRRGWREVGKMQFDYLRSHGLTREQRMLEIGCGNLRAGWRFIRYLEPGNYYGIDISPEVLLAAEDTVVRRELTAKLPYLALCRDMKFAFLPDDHFDVVHAHSVFSHSPLPVIEECFAHVGRIMREGAIFDFTFDRTEAKEYTRLREDFYYRTETLIAAAERHGLSARFMDDWEALGHIQSKIRITK